MKINMNIIMAFMLISTMPLAAADFFDDPLYDEYKQYRTYGETGADVEIEMFMGFEELFSANFHEDTFKELFSEYGQDGRVAFTHYDNPSHDYQTNTHEAGWCVIHASEDIDKKSNFWQFREYMYTYQDNISEDTISTWVSQLGEGSVNMATFDTCMEDEQFKEFVLLERDIARNQNGFDGVPAFKVNNVEIEGAQDVRVFKNTINDLLRIYDSSIRLQRNETETIDGIDVTALAVGDESAIFSIQDELKVMNEEQSKRWSLDLASVEIKLLKANMHKQEVIVEIKVNQLGNNEDESELTTDNISANLSENSDNYPNNSEIEAVRREIRENAESNNVERETYNLPSGIPEAQSNEFTLDVKQRKIVNNIIFALDFANEDLAKLSLSTPNQAKNIEIKRNVEYDINDEYAITYISNENEKDGFAMFKLTEISSEVPGAANSKIATSQNDASVNSNAKVNVEQVETTAANTATETQETCENGCQLNGDCIPLGVRADGKYCDISGEMKEQLEESNSCENNYECSTNQCSSGTCIDLNKELEKQSNLMKRIMNWFRI